MVFPPLHVDGLLTLRMRAAFAGCKSGKSALFRATRQGWSRRICRSCKQPQKTNARLPSQIEQIPISICCAIRGVANGVRAASGPVRLADDRYIGDYWYNGDRRDERPHASDLIRVTFIEDWPGRRASMTGGPL
jgi:hypothetical protein